MEWVDRTGYAQNLRLGSLARIIWARRKIFFIVFGAITAASVAFCYLVPESYRSDAMLLVSDGRSEAQQARFADYLRFRVNSQLFVVESEGVIREAIAATGLDKLFPALRDDFEGRFAGAEKDAAVSDAAYVKARKQLGAAAEKDSQILRLSFTHEDPRLAARFLNAVIDVFMKKQAQLTGNAEAPAFFREQALRYRAEYDRASQELSKFSKAHSAYSVEQQRKLALDRRDDLKAALATTKGTILEKESQAAKLQDTLTGLKRTVGFPPEVRGPKYAPPPGGNDRSTDLPNGDPPLLLVRVYQDTAQQLVTINAAVAGLRSLEESQRASLASIDTELASLSSLEADFDRLKREVDQAATYLEAHIKRAAEAQIDADWDASEKLSSVKVVQRATVPIKPVFPQKPLFIGLGMIAGLIGGAGVSLVLHQRATRPEARATAAAAASGFVRVAEPGIVQQPGRPPQPARPQRVARGGKP
jgi:polysaccharide biosynthesis transport protein